MMHNIINILFLFFSVSEAFLVGTPSQTLKHSMSSLEMMMMSSSSSSTSTNEENDAFVSTRRESIIKASSAILTTASIMFNSESALADDNDSVQKQDGGRLIEFIVENLNGQPGNSGRIVIKTHPDWAPNGVKRCVLWLCMS